jgi:hypothetical protein
VAFIGAPRRPGRDEKNNFSPCLASKSIQSGLTTYIQIFHICRSVNADSQWPRGLRHEPSSSDEHWGRGFASHSRHGYLCTFILCLCCSVCR